MMSNIIDDLIVLADELDHLRDSKRASIVDSIIFKYAKKKKNPDFPIKSKVQKKVLDKAEKSMKKRKKSKDSPKITDEDAYLYGTYKKIRENKRKSKK